MDQFDKSDMQVHVTLLGWLYIAGHAIFLLVGICGFLFLRGIGGIAGDPIATRVLTLIGTLGATFFTILSLPGFLAGFGLLKRESWARILALILAFLNLVNFPFGTALGIYAFFVLLQREASEYFT
ncbi:MAG TPA: hypothetical protein G4O11_13825 [Anaerolineae bacterium]|nr:hypothetical protein [Anaerolineae bacterium]